MHDAGLGDRLGPGLRDAPGRPLSPSQTTMSTSRVPRFLISVRIRSQYLALAVAVLPGPQARRGNAQHGVNGPVGHLPVPDLDVDHVDEQHCVDRIQRAGECHSTSPSSTRSVIVEMVSRETSAP